MAELLAAFVNIQSLNATFARLSDMSIDVDEYPMRGTIIAPRGDTSKVRFHVYDENGLAFDVSSATEITFTVSTDESSPPLFLRTLTGGHITVTGNQITVQLTPTQTNAPPYSKSYYELRVEMIVSSVQEQKTVAAGVFRSVQTVLGIE